MTTNDDPLARRALFVAFEGMGVLDLTGPHTVFLEVCQRAFASADVDSVVCVAAALSDNVSTHRRFWLRDQKPLGPM
jgi:hypothetical protein